MIRDPLCMERQPFYDDDRRIDKGGWYCSLAPGHDGPHVAYYGHNQIEGVAARWTTVPKMTAERTRS